MVKTVSLPDIVYSELVSIAGELTSMARKPFSLGMTVSVLSATYRTFYQMVPGSKEKLEERLRKLDVLSPEEFEKVYEHLYKVITGEG